MDAHLRVLIGDSAGETIEIPQGKFLIGRETDCHLRREGGFLSRHHCVLLHDEYTLRLRDLGSKNGTFVNGHRIGAGATILLNGDMVEVGEIMLEVTIASSLAEAQSSILGLHSDTAHSAFDATRILSDDMIHAN